MTKFTAKTNTTVDIAKAVNIFEICTSFKNLSRPDRICTQKPYSPPMINPING